MLSHSLKLRTSWFFLAGTALLWIGCGSPNNTGQSVTTTQASQISSAMVTTSSTIQAQTLPELNKLKKARDNSEKFSGTWVSGTLEQFTVQGTLNNSQGTGTAEISGQGSYQSSQFSVTLQVKLTDWQSGDLTISGTVTVTFSATATGTLSSKTTVNGALQVKGLVTGRPNAAVPVNIAIEVQTSGTKVTVCGTVASVEVGEGACS